MAEERTAGAAGRAPGWLVVYGSLMRGLPARETRETHAARTALDASARTSPNTNASPSPGPEPTTDPHGSTARDPADASPDLLDQLGVAAGLRRVGPCRFPGRLFDLGPYPALRPARGPADQVCGELHALLDPGVFAVLDPFEGFDPADPARSDYLRERIALLEPAGVEAWIYVFNREPEAVLRVASGDWRAHLAERAHRAHDPVVTLRGGTARWDS